MISTPVQPYASAFEAMDEAEFDRFADVLFELNPYNPLSVDAVNICTFDDNAVLLAAARLPRSAARAGFGPGVLRYRTFFPRALRALRPLERALHWLPLGAQSSYHASRP
jgi:hypothetical protein